MGRFGLFGFLFLLQWTLVGGATVPSYFELAEHYAPAIYQQSESEFLDYLTRFDFDGDLNGSNNWKNASRFMLPAYVYYAVIESSSHYFITYAFFHPRDYTARPFEGFAPKTEHENDMEGCTLIVEKDQTDWGKPLFLETLAHDKFFLYANRSSEGLTSRLADIVGPLIFLEPDPTGHHREPAVFIEAEGHGVQAETARILEEEYEHPGIIYRYTGGGAEVPSHQRDQWVSYELLSLEDSLWPLRYSIGPEAVYCCGHSYDLPSGLSAVWGESFNGPIGGCAARPPWGWDEPDDGPIQKGDWFRDPLKTYSQRLSGPGFPGGYIHNPYLAPQGESPESLPLCGETSESKDVKESIFATLIGIAGEIFSGGFGKEEIKKRGSQLFLINTPLLEWTGRQGLGAWDWDPDSDFMSEPSFIGEDREALLRMSLSEPIVIKSPALNAPARYFNQLIIRYRAQLQRARMRLTWRFDAATEETEDFSTLVQLPETTEWSIMTVDLTRIEGWDPSRSVTGIELEFSEESEPTSWIDELESSTAEKKAGSLEIHSIVFDREAFSDTFSR